MNGETTSLSDVLDVRIRGETLSLEAFNVVIGRRTNVVISGESVMSKVFLWA